MTHNQEKCSKYKLLFIITQMLQLAEKDLKAAIVSIFKDIKEDICIMNKHEESQQKNRN